MKRLKIILLILGIVLAGSANLMAQHKAQKPPSAKASYHKKNKESKASHRKKQKEKQDWRVHSKPARGTKSADLSRKKSHKS